MDNIFTALVRRRTTGVVMEFVLWCIVCFAALLSLIALAMGAGNFVWILLLLTAAGLGVIMAFRLKEVALLYSVCVFNAILFLIHYLVFSVSYGGGPQTAFSIVLFILTFLLSLAVVACAFVQFFSRVNMGTVLTILEICNVALIMIMQILMYAAQCKRFQQDTFVRTGQFDFSHNPIAFPSFSCALRLFLSKAWA